LKLSTFVAEKPIVDCVAASAVQINPEGVFIQMKEMIRRTSQRSISPSGQRYVVRNVGTNFPNSQCTFPFEPLDLVQFFVFGESSDSSRGRFGGETNMSASGGMAGSGDNEASLVTAGRL
jgi:hypothetical protein